MCMNSNAVVRIVPRNQEGLVIVDFLQPRGGHAEVRFLPQSMTSLDKVVFGLVLAFGKPRKLKVQ
jgi:hypothetical protein